MTPEDRDAAFVAAIAKKRDALTRLKAAGEERRIKALSEIDAKIEAGRADALVMLDAWESSRQEQPDDKVKLDEVLALAIIAHKRANPSSRGERLWLLRTVYVCLGFNGCGHRSTTYATAGDADIEQGSPERHCPECANDVAEDKGPAGRDRAVCCRFCGFWMGDGQIGTDYSTKVFYNTDGEGRSHDWKSVDVREHTVVCALRHLAQITPGARDEGELITINIPEEAL
jgi:hypothetical protein